jgi:nicotinamidase-related amidase
MNTSKQNKLSVYGLVASQTDCPPCVLLSTKSTALLVIDVQPEYWSFCPEVRRDFPDFPTNLSRTINTCRRQGVKIIWIRADYRYNYSPWLPEFERLRGENNAGQIAFNSANPSEIQWEVFARPLENETVIPKHNFSSTSETALIDILKASGIETVLICGLITSICVNFSCYGIFEAGFRPILVQDACADRGIERHNAVILLYGDYMYNVVCSTDLKFDDKTDLKPEKHVRNIARLQGHVRKFPADVGLEENYQAWSRSTSRTASAQSLVTLMSEMDSAEIGPFCSLTTTTTTTDQHWDVEGPI